MDRGHRSGGSLELARLIDEAGEDLIPDLKQYYGIDLRDLFSEDKPLSPRWALMHVLHLPIESAFVAQLRGGPEFRGWSPDRYMAARLIDLQAIQNWMFLSANRDPDSKAPEMPEPYPLPDDIKVKKQLKDKPGSFGFMAKTLLAKAKKRKAAGG
ncbi:hypothetical protein MINTMi198_17320 [Mycobacterium intracellulare M.i.198]|uniref:hypothetical protein n=1 Tax=Mycobacterium intracellulare TaxID=1767 RepID=UPI000366EDA1|nr:hypothetical protein [Mycobacterium intracellulare]BCP36362.1 hypothetical protein MINTMi198_17320 [Mycobacterium intracellulare M.i.198]